MSDATMYTVTARLVAEAGTPALLRIVSILHSRCADIRELSFEAEYPTGATVEACVRLTNAGSGTLLESLRRPVEVLEVTMDTRHVLELVDPKRNWV